MADKKRSARDMLNAAHDAGNEQEASRSSSSEGEYCQHCGQHKMAPKVAGSDFSDADVINSVRKIQKTVGRDI